MEDQQWPGVNYRGERVAAIPELEAAYAEYDAVCRRYAMVPINTWTEKTWSVLEGAARRFQEAKRAHGVGQYRGY